MADIVSAIDYVLLQEDSRMSGEVNHDPLDPGGRTRFGIAERWHPELTATGYFDDMPRAAALIVAHNVYVKQYGAPLHVEDIEHQQLANAMLSFAINEGTATSIMVLQKALAVAVDGVIGPATLRELNTTSVLPLLARQQSAHYAAIVEKNPSAKRFFKGWINRVNLDCEC